MRVAAVAALLGALGVGAGAFGAHGLRDTLTPAALANWLTAAQYQQIHAVAALVAATAFPKSRAALLFVLGIAVFSGTLYLLALTGVRWLGAVTPIGGVLMILGWLALVVAAARSQLILLNPGQD